MACLPVDSATSCSSHRPEPGSESAIRKVSLSRPERARALRAAPSQTAPVPGDVLPVGLQRRLPGSRGALEQRSDIDAHQRGGDDAEGGQGAVAPADVGVAEEGVPEAVLGGQLGQARAWVGDRDEVRAVVDEGVEVGEEGERLDRSSRLR